MAKARVSPTKVTSIPSLELSAAVMAARMSVLLKAELQMNIDQEYFWTDSQVVLAYNNNEAKRFHVFVANRVQLIRETTNPNNWYYVDTAENPADHASRGLRAVHIASASWLLGPKFLWEREVLPTLKHSAELCVGDPEIKMAQVCAVQASEQMDILYLLDRFSTWTTLFKVVARIKRLGSKVKTSNTVTAEKRRKAAAEVIKLIQQEAFPKELKALQSRGQMHSFPKTSPLFRLNLMLVDGLLCIGGRLKG